MQKINDRIEKARINGHEIITWRPVSIELVTEVENALDLQLPPSFLEFICEYGGGGINGLEISGILRDDPLATNEGTLFGDTYNYRKEHGLPLNLLVIQSDPDGNDPHCLDTSEVDEIGENPVICYSLYQGNTTRLANDFVEYYLKFSEPYINNIVS